MLKNHLLSQSLGKTWAQYEKQVHLSRRRTSPKNIHELRVTTQKLEAVLTLVNSLHSTHHSKNLIALIKNVRKSLGPLRDIQVQSTALVNLRDQNLIGHRQREFSSFFTEQEKKAKKKAIKCLENISLSKEKKRINNLTKKLKKIELSHDKKKIQNQLDSKIKLTVSKFNRVMKNINPEQVKKIHKFRILAKKLRYQGECLNSITGLNKYDLKKLKLIQSVAGRIQNDSILIGTLDKFLSQKKHKGDLKAIKIKKRIKDNQSKLIKKDFKELSSIKWVN